ncbi:hypothetical protein FB639_003500, partial [Coemansia asiatica]
QLSEYSPPRPSHLVSASVADMTSTVKKKKRRLHAGRAVLDVGTPDSDYDGDQAGSGPVALSASTSLLTPSKIAGSWPPASPANIPREPGAANAKVAKPSVPQTNKQPVLFTPVRTRSKTQVSADLSPPTMSLNDHNGAMRGDERADNIFLTPIKMLSRLRNRKK